MTCFWTVFLFPLKVVIHCIFILNCKTVGLPRCKNLWIFSLFRDCLCALYCFGALCCLARSLFYVTGEFHRMSQNSSASIIDFSGSYTVSMIKNIYAIKITTCKSVINLILYWIEIKKQYCYQQMSLVFLKKIMRAFKRGLETSRNVGYLFYYFLTM